MLNAAKIATATGVALWLGLIALGNAVDYPTNFEFVQHVMSMDTTFPGNRLMGRAITASWAHHAGYALIIAVEWLIALLCGWGAVELLRARRQPGRLAKGRRLVAAGYLAGILLFFVGFLAIGGEWFAMWQSATWNGVDAAFRAVVILALFLIILYLPDPDEAADRKGNARVP